MHSTQTDKNLDDILNSALEDFNFLEQSHLPPRPNTTSTAPTPTPTQTTNPLDFSATIEEATKNMQEQPDVLLDQMFKEFESSSSGYQGMLQNMMKQLLAKEVLYEPMKEMHVKYAPWLQANKDKLSPTDYQNYLKQYGYIEKILYLYDKDAEGDKSSFDEILRLMREMQYCGQVPAEIVKQLAPDVEFGADGQPKFPGLEGLDNLNVDQCTLL